jgi:hypothetical protein
MMVVMMVGEYYGDCDGYWWLMMMVIAIVDGDNAYDITTTAVMFSECFSCVRHCAMSSPCIISLNPNTTNRKVLITATEIKGGPTTSVKKKLYQERSRNLSLFRESFNTSQLVFKYSWSRSWQ